ncbi:hypothetical protein SAMN05444581_10632 [Methylocapsa palsarum]|uniref:Uncharacterized protein n=1 Tax=Methylocapsa palsarum TaxID=1612308 RepID=A0A1I3YMW7_9HYPH|nr:hypothetical protein SAMN05444581_10632 [Methylocapsa palsarum]
MAQAALGLEDSAKLGRNVDVYKSLSIFFSIGLFQSDRNTL